ncbi:prolyl 3-hydroxylase 3 isoform X3 [Falco rusticolus]|uniref:prolyl 3-hydroxylase 3 isoform X3 n=1 Tax=Falco rusticolus TaxID=120794 RepID=UPI0018869F6B|nr:prolyl 3-hydroxylase 3 isoform X3 [Falco rusticolus]
MKLLHRLLEGKGGMCEAPFLPLLPFLVSALEGSRCSAAQGRERSAWRSCHGSLGERFSLAVSGDTRAAYSYAGAASVFSDTAQQKCQLLVPVGTLHGNMAAHTSHTDGKVAEPSGGSPQPPTPPKPGGVRSGAGSWPPNPPGRAVQGSERRPGPVPPGAGCRSSQGPGLGCRRAALRLQSASPCDGTVRPCPHRRRGQPQPPGGTALGPGTRGAARGPPGTHQPAGPCRAVLGPPRPPAKAAGPAGPEGASAPAPAPAQGRPASRPPRPRPGPRGGLSPRLARLPPPASAAMASLLGLGLLLAAAATSPGRLVPYDLLYADGVRAYFARDWGRAAELLQRALHSYAGLRAARRACRAACRREAAFLGGPPAGSGPWEAALFGRVLQRADCLQHCLGRRLGAAPSAHRASLAIRRDFQQREPYNYLQVAFFQLKKLDQAVSAAHTFFVANPQHLQMREDIEKYRRMSGVKSDNFRDLEATPHWEAYEAGVQHYNADEYVQAVARLEESLTEALSALEECRALCEGPWEDEVEEEEEMQPGLYEAIAAHYIQVLKCRQQCVLEIATKPGRISATEDFIPSHLDLLQFAYDQVGNQTLAAECAASYLLFYPTDELMLEKMREYRTELGEDTAITARQNIEHYVQRSLMEKKLIYYAVEHLGGVFNDPDLWTPDDLIPENLKGKHREDQEKQKQQTLDVEEWEKREPHPSRLDLFCCCDPQCTQLSPAPCCSPSKPKVSAGS